MTTPSNHFVEQCVEATDWDGIGWQRLEALLDTHPGVLRVETSLSYAKPRGERVEVKRVYIDGNVWRDAHAHAAICRQGYVAVIVEP